MKWYQKTVMGSSLATELNKLQHEGIDTLNVKIAHFPKGNAFMYVVVFQKEEETGEIETRTITSPIISPKDEGSDIAELLTKLQTGEKD